MKTLKFIVADDNLAEQHLLAARICELKHLVVGLAIDGKMLIDLVDEHKPDFIISDTVMPMMDGITACKEIKRKHPNIHSICTSSMKEMSLPFYVKQNHFQGFLIKDFTAAKLQNCINTILAGKTYVDILFKEKLIKQIARMGAEFKDLASLIRIKELDELANYEKIIHESKTIKITSKHILIVSAIYHGMKSASVASLAGIEQSSVEQSLKRLRSKLSVETKMSLIKLFMAWGFILRNENDLLQ